MAVDREIGAATIRAVSGPCTMHIFAWVEHTLRLLASFCRRANHCEKKKTHSGDGFDDDWEWAYEWRTVCEGTRHRADFYVETEGGTLFVNGSKHDPSKVTD